VLVRPVARHGKRGPVKYTKGRSTGPLPELRELSFPLTNGGRLIGDLRSAHSRGFDTSGVPSSARRCRPETGLLTPSTTPRRRTLQSPGVVHRADGARQQSTHWIQHQVSATRAAFLTAFLANFRAARRTGRVRLAGEGAAEHAHQRALDVAPPEEALPVRPRAAHDLEAAQVASALTPGPIISRDIHLLQSFQNLSLLLKLTNISQIMIRLFIWP